MRKLLATALLIAGTVITVQLGAATPASAHVERPSYWPDPAADCTVSPCAGGHVPKARSLASALNKKARGETRVVCKDNSMSLLRASIADARKNGWLVRPTERRSLSAAQAAQLLKINQGLWKMCSFHNIQAAVTASGNNDRVVVMPGLYLEQPSRNQLTHDPSCVAKYTIPADSGDPGALSHEYQLRCPNDANLVAIIGRGSDVSEAPSPPLDNRHGIPGVGKCIRCNFQLEGSGVSANDVTVEAGDPKAGNGGPSAAGYVKDVGIFADRADGLVLRNLAVRHAREHGIYILETDGYRFEYFKTYYNGGYGVLTFVEDHGLMQRCEATGSGDSGLYPGSGADSTDNRYKPFYPKYRFSQVIRYCDSHHNTGGFSGTDSHGTLITKNNFFDNALGFTTDVFTAPGHPGFPQHGNVVRNNNFYDNNYNPFAPGSEVAPFIPAPVGTGLWFAGGNNNKVVGNHFYDNWRRGVMLFAVPDALVCGPEPVGSDTPVPGCDPLGVSTSFGNSFYNNTMGVTPSGKTKPNGVDFWWDSFAGNTGNCWWDNTGPDGAAVTSTPSSLPDCSGGTDPGSSIGTTDVVNESELVACFAGFTLAGYPQGEGNTCSWTTIPAKPGTPGAGKTTAHDRANQMAAFLAVCDEGLAVRLCAPYHAMLAERVTVEGAQRKYPTLNGVAPAQTDGKLSLYTCSWWRKADRAHRLGMVQRIRHFATLPVQGDVMEGYGAGMPDARAMRVLTGRCSFTNAGPFALYKLYGAAAAFSAVS